MKIVLRKRENADWNLVETVSYGNEAELQDLLAESPLLISIQEIREDAESLLVTIREFSLPVGYIDLLAFSSAGDIAVIECKLASSPEVKQKSFWLGTGVGSLFVANELGGAGAGCLFTFRQSLAKLMEKAIEGANWDEEVFRNNVENALSDGNFTLIIVVNEINKELTRIVQYGNVCGIPEFDFCCTGNASFPKRRH